MLKLATLATVTFLAAAGSSRAAYFDTGNDYWARCFGKENIVCTATASAYADMMETLGYKCSADGVSRTQTKDVLLKFLADYPEKRNSAASTLAAVAFIKAFGCAKSEK